MSLLSKTAEHLGHEISDETHKVLAAIERTPEYINKILSHAGLGFMGGGHHAPHIPNLIGHTRPIKPSVYGGSIPDALRTPIVDGCAAGGAKPWTITSTVAIAAGALAADTDLGSTTNPFASANSAFFSSTGVFPWPFVCYGIGGMIMGQLPASETEFASVMDSFYVSMRGATELARYSLTRDLGFGMVKEQGLSITTSGAATAVNMIQPLPMKAWEQFFDPRSTYTWGFRLPKAVTSAAAMQITIILCGLLYEGLVLTAN